MRVKTGNMTEGRLGTQILFFSLPLIASNLLQILFNLADIAVVGRFCGASALGSVGSTSTTVVLFTGFLIGITSGVNVLTARYCGAQSAQDADEAVHTAAVICLISGICALLLGETGAPFIMRLLRTKEELIDGAVLYLRIYSIGLPALSLYNFGNAVLSAVGDTRRPLYYLSFAGVLNVILNLFFVIICGLGVAGVAVASAISQYVSAILIIRALLTDRGMWALRWKRIRIIPEKAGYILKLGLPSGFQNALFAIANSFILAGVNSFDAVTVEGNAAAMNADGLVYDIMAAFYTACASFISQNYGARKPERVKKAYRISLAYSFGVGMLIGLCLVIFGRSFLSLFTTDVKVIDAGMGRLIIMGCSYGFSAFMDCSVSASRGLGKTLVPTIMLISGVCAFRIIWIYTVFAFFHTVPSLYMLYIFSWAITGIAEVLYYKKCLKDTLRSL